MNIHVLNSCIELWQKYNDLKNALDTLNTKREVLGEQLRLRKFDIDQHLVNTLRREGRPGHYDDVRETICDVVQKINDNDAICDIYRSLFNILDQRVKDAYSSICALQVTNDTADVEAKILQLTDQTEAFRHEVIAHREYIEKLKNRSWWQRLFNTEPKQHQGRAGTTDTLETP